MKTITNALAIEQASFRMDLDTFLTRVPGCVGTGIEFE